jgi:hypothetical protein
MKGADGFRRSWVYSLFSPVHMVYIAGEMLQVKGPFSTFRWSQCLNIFSATFVEGIA